MANRLSKKPAGKTKKKKSTSRKITKKTTVNKKPGKGVENLYTLAVYIIGGPLSEEYDGKVTCRTIQIKGSQTLQDLHYAIFDAFDFGGDWQHQINVEAIEPAPVAGKYPKVIKRLGDSPPQYPDWDDEEDEE